MLLDILEYPDPRLRKVATPVVTVTPEVRKLVRDLAETMYAAPGIGLSATQVDMHKRIIVIDVSPNRPDLLSHIGVAREIAAARRELLDVLLTEVKIALFRRHARAPAP